MLKMQSADQCWKAKSAAVSQPRLFPLLNEKEVILAPAPQGAPSSRPPAALWAACLPQPVLEGVVTGKRGFWCSRCRGKSGFWGLWVSPHPRQDTCRPS